MIDFKRSIILRFRAFYGLGESALSAVMQPE